MTTVRKARLTRIGWEDDLAVETSEVDFQEPEGDQVRVEVEACGVCHRVRSRRQTPDARPRGQTPDPDPDRGLGKRG